jgi:hypothetical protein
MLDHLCTAEDVWTWLALLCGNHLGWVYPVFDLWGA